MIGRTAEGPVYLPAGVGSVGVLGGEGLEVVRTLQTIALQAFRGPDEPQVFVLDPVGDLSRQVLDALTDEEVQDTVLFQPARNVLDLPGENLVRVVLPFNVLAQRSPPQDPSEAEPEEERASSVAADLQWVVEHRLGPDPPGGGALALLGALVRGLATVDGATLADLPRALERRETFLHLSSRVKNEWFRLQLLRGFPWGAGGGASSSAQRAAAVIGELLDEPTLVENLSIELPPNVGGTERPARGWEARLLLLNLGKEEMTARGRSWKGDPDRVRLLGALLLNALWSHLDLRRSSVPRPPPRSVYLVVDGASLVDCPSLRSMLIDLERFGLRVILGDRGSKRPTGEAAPRSAVLGSLDTWLLLPCQREEEDSLRRVLPTERAPQVPMGALATLSPREGFVLAGDLGLRFEARPGFPHRDPRSEAPKELCFASALPRSTVLPLHVSPLVYDEAALRSVLTELLPRPTRWGPLQRLCLNADGLSEERFRPSFSHAELLGLVGRVQPWSARWSVTPLGRRFLEVLQAKRAGGREGPLHNLLLAKVVDHLEREGLSARVSVQKAAHPSPDAEAEADGVLYHVEVECGSLDPLSEQLVRNAQKAWEAHRRLIWVTEDWEAAKRLETHLRKRLPAFQRDRDYCILFEGFRGGFWRHPGGESTDPRLPPWSTSPKSPDGRSPPDPAPSDLAQPDDLMLPGPARSASSDPTRPACPAHAARPAQRGSLPVAPPAPVPPVPPAPPAHHAPLPIAEPGQPGRIPAYALLLLPTLWRMREKDGVKVSAPEILAATEGPRRAWYVDARGKARGKKLGDALAALGCKGSLVRNERVGRWVTTYDLSGLPPPPARREAKAPGPGLTDPSSPVPPSREAIARGVLEHFRSQGRPAFTVEECLEAMRPEERAQFGVGKGDASTRSLGMFLSRAGAIPERVKGLPGKQAQVYVLPEWAKGRRSNAHPSR